MASDVDAIAAMYEAPFLAVREPADPSWRSRAVCVGGVLAGGDDGGVVEVEAVDGRLGVGLGERDPAPAFAAADVEDADRFAGFEPAMYVGAAPGEGSGAPAVSITKLAMRHLL